MTSFFKDAKNISIKGGIFNVVDGGMQVFDNSRHMTNVNSFNTRNDTMVGSQNNNSLHYHGASSNLTTRNMGRDRPRSSTADYDSGRKPAYALPPPPTLPAHMDLENAPPGSRIHIQDSFNTTNNLADNVYNNNSQEYEHHDSRGSARRNRTTAQTSQEDVSMEDPSGSEDDSDDEQSSPSPATPPSASGPNTNAYSPGVYGAHSYSHPNPAQYGYPYPYGPPLPQQAYQCQQYANAPPVANCHRYAAHAGGYMESHQPQIFQMGEEQKRQFEDVMSSAMRQVAKDVQEIHDESKSTSRASVQEVDASDDEGEVDQRPTSNYPPTSPRNGLSTDMANMALDESARPEFSRVKSTPSGGASIAASDAGPSASAKRKRPHHSNSDPEIPPHLKDRAFAGFGAPSGPSPFGPDVSGAGISYTTHQNGYTHVDNSVHTSSHGSYNYTHNLTQDSHNDNSVRASGMIEADTSGRPSTSSTEERRNRRNKGLTSVRNL